MDTPEVVQPVTSTTPVPQTSFLRGAFSDRGEPSSSRMLTSALGCVVALCVMGLLFRICTLKDNQALALWLTNLPVIIGSLVGLMAAPYTVNQGAQIANSIVGAFKKQP